MAQLRRDYQEFARRGAEIIVVGPESREVFKQVWDHEGFPFVGLADPDHRVARLYGQQVRWIKLGRMPALVVVDKRGRIYCQHHGKSMGDIPPNDRVLTQLDELNQAEKESDAHLF